MSNDETVSMVMDEQRDFSHSVFNSTMLYLSAAANSFLKEIENDDLQPYEGLSLGLFGSLLGFFVKGQTYREIRLMRQYQT